MWQQRTATRNRLIYRIVLMPGRLCISSYAAKSSVVSSKGAACHSKAGKRPGWWIGKFTLFWMPATCMSKGWHPLPTPPTANEQELLERGRGLHAETAQSAQTVNLKLIISGLTSVIVIALGTVSLQFQDQFVSISLRQILGTVAARIVIAVQSLCS